MRFKSLSNCRHLLLVILPLALTVLFSSSAQAARTINSATVNGGSSVTVTPGASITVSLNVTTTGGGSSNDWESTDWLIATSSGGSYTCNDHNDSTSAGTHDQTFTITAPTTPGTYNAYFEAYQNDNCSGGGSTIFTLSNAITVSSGGLSLTFYDQFNSTSYSNQDGTENWATSWTESGESDGPSGGDIRITGGELRLKDDDRSISRSVDLSAYSSATLSFDYRESSLDNSNDWIDLEIRTGGSGSWTQLTRFSGSSNDSGTYSTDISSYISTNTEIRFITSSSLGNNDQFFVDDFGIDASGSGGGSCGAATVADNFGSVSYAQNDGTRNWAGDWQEIGESDGASSGLVRVRNDLCTGGNCLRLGVVNGNSAQSYSNVGASREVDLSGSTTATLTFNYRSGVTQNSQTVVLQASSNGGSSWSTLRTYNISSSNFSATAESVPLTPYIASNTQIRFLATGSNAVVGMYIDDIQIAYNPCSTLLAEWRMDEASWNGTADEVVDNTGNNYHAVAVNGATTASATPAVAGNPGTCGYGYFDDAGSSNGNYLALNNFPNSTTDFTMTAWIRSSDVSRSGQRVFADDQSNTGGYALSLGDPGSGRLRFYARATSPVSLDTPSIISNDTWYFVAAVADITNKQKTIYVYSADGTLLNTTNGSYSGTWGTDSGPASIGGETNSGESGNRFFGNLDEVRYYEEALSSAQIAAIRAETHSCSGGPVAHWRFDETGWSGAANEVVDSEGTNHGLANSADPVSGQLCNAADLSATGTSDYLSLGAGALNGATDFTISAWVKTSNTNSQALLSGANSSQANELIMWFPSATSFEPWLKGTDPASISIGNIADDQWHHLVWTRSGSQNCIYRDASLQGCTTGSTSALDIDSGGLILGQEQDSVGGGFDLGQDWRGLVDELLIFNEAVSASQVTSIYNNTLAGDNWDAAERTCPTTTSCTVTFRDNFTVAGFSNNDGDADWAGSWSEVDGDGLGATTGNVQIFNGELYLDDNPNTGGTPGVTREVDLSGYDTATLRLNHRTTSGVDSNDQVSLEISSNGGSNWTVLQNYTGISGTSSGSSSFNISSYISTNTQIRLRVTSFYGGGSESFVVDHIEIEAEDTDCDNQVDHYAISHSEQGVTCEASSITITAHDSSDAAVEPGSGVTMTLNTNTGFGDWSLSSGGGSVANGTANDGIATYAWADGESSVVLALAHTEVTGAPHMDIDITDNNSATDKDGDSSEDPRLAFREAVLKFYDASASSEELPHQIAGNRSDLPPNAATLQLRAITTDPNTGACLARVQNQSLDVALGYQCLDPSSCISGREFRLLDRSGIERVLPDTVSLNFDAQGRAPIPIVYDDVGQVKMSASLTLAESEPVSETVLSGSSTSFTVRPFAFHIDVTGNPAASTATGSPFKAAGEAFTATVTAVPWASSDDSDNDGVPDSGADLSDNGVTANFGQESTAETVTLTQGLVLPAGGTNPALSNATFSGFSAGASTKSNLSWSEVGIISLTANLTDGSYLGAGDVTGTAPYVGRFYPDHFLLSGPNLSNRTALSSCVSSDFTYMGEKFGVDFTLTARNTGGGTTTNYEGDFARINSRGELNLAVVNDGALIAPSRLEQAGNVVWTEGVLDMVLELVVHRSGGVDGPFDNLSIGIAPKDSSIGGDPTVLNSFNLDVEGDGSNGHGKLGDTKIRYGRLVVNNAFGPETEDLEVPLQVQYYNGSRFVLHSDDSCTPYSSSKASLDHSDYGSDNLNVGDTLITASASSAVVSSGESPSGLPLVLEAPGVGKEGQVDLILDVDDWLKFDWEGSGDQNPQGQASFGRYRGNDRMIFWQENFSQ
ncbi:DUF6701 domain-containing protein [Motiliproteus sp.]|uniref:DUF6701 domain-containing protein n=1 Tax=Motiliproteus sp. TaxID=1898955 RepID=UPI003BABCB3C